MKPRLTIVTVQILFAVAILNAAEPIAFPTNAPARIELRDQYDEPQTLSFPRTNVTILAIADRKGSDEVAGWIAALKPKYAGRVDIRGLADVAGVPGWLQGRIRKKFQETHKYPVMMDWTGQTCERIAYRAGTANILVIDRDGRICGRFCGEANDSMVKEAFRAVDAALASNGKLP